MVYPGSWPEISGTLVGRRWPNAVCPAAIAPWCARPASAAISRTPPTSTVPWNASGNGLRASISITPICTVERFGPTTSSRYRQWMTHKLSTWWNQFDESGCVGCGRCIAWCPVGIDITEEAAAIRASDGVLIHRHDNSIEESDVSDTVDVMRNWAGHGFLAGLSAHTVTLLSEVARLEEFEAGALLLREGESADTIFLIAEGRVAIEIHSPSRGPLVIDTIEPGHIVGLSWVAPPFRWQFDARALTYVEAVAFDASRLSEAGARTPNLQPNFTGVLLRSCCRGCRPHGSGSLTSMPMPAAH